MLLFFDRRMCTTSTTWNVYTSAWWSEDDDERTSMSHFFAVWSHLHFKKTSFHFYSRIKHDGEFNFLPFLCILEGGRRVCMAENYFDPLNCQHRFPLIKSQPLIWRKRKKVKLNNRTFNGRQIYYLNFSPLTHNTASFRMGIFIISDHQCTK